MKSVQRAVCYNIFCIIDDIMSWFVKIKHFKTELTGTGNNCAITLVSAGDKLKVFYQYQ